MENINETEPVKNNITQEVGGDEHIYQYIAENRPSIYILTPCYGGMCNTHYVTCLLRTKELFNKYQIPIQFLFCRNDSLVTRARNNLIAKAMNDPTATHFFFIDSDISWNENDVLKLMLANKPIIGGVYPLKRYNWNKLTVDPNNPYNSNIVQSVIDNINQSVLKNAMSNEDIVQCHLLNYNVKYLDRILSIDANLAKVKYIETGFMMIQRDVLTQMMGQNPQLKYTDDTGFLKENENRYTYALFNCGIAYNHYLSEDWFFCERWLNMGGDIFIDVTINLTHTGNVDFKGNFLSSIL
jgi:hypothetical protein